MKIGYIAIGLIVLMAVGIMGANGAGAAGKPDDAGIPRLEVENNTVVFIGFSNESTWNITAWNSTNNPDNYFDEYNSGTMDLTQRKILSVMYVVDYSSNPSAIQIEVPGYGDYEAIIYGIDGETIKTLTTTLHVLEE